MSISRLLFVVLLGLTCANAAILDCNETLSLNCHVLAGCQYDNVTDTVECVCPPGTVTASTDVPANDVSGRQARGVGDCLTQSYTIRTVLRFVSVPADDADLIDGYVDAILGDPPNLGSKGMTRAILRKTVLIETLAGSDVVTLNALVEYKEDALRIVGALEGLNATEWSASFSSATVSAVEWGSRMYRYSTGTSSDFRAIAPSGLEVLTTSFDWDCMFAGCWVIDILYTTGGDESLNVLYIPRSKENNADPVANPAAGTVLVYPDTTQPRNFPCGSLTVDTTGGLNGALTRQETSCCMHDFFQQYRTNADFPDFLTKHNVTNEVGTPTVCTSFAADAFVDNAFLDSFPTGDLVVGNGKFDGLNRSTITHTGVRDARLNQNTARLRLDERELRSLAAVREGTISAQYTLDFYIGIAEFKPTDTAFLDSALKQVPIHLEKSDFFTVSTYSFVGFPEERICCGEGNGTGCELDNNGNAYCPPERWNSTCMDWLVTNPAAFDRFTTYCCKHGYFTAEEEALCDSGPCTGDSCEGRVKNCDAFYDANGVYYTVPVFVNGTVLPFEESPWNVTLIGANAEAGQGACCKQSPDGTWNMAECFDEACIQNTDEGENYDCKTPCFDIFKARNMDPRVYRPSLPAWALLDRTKNEIEAGFESDLTLPNGTVFSSNFVLNYDDSVFKDESVLSWMDWTKCCMLELQRSDFDGTKFEMCASQDWEGSDPTLSPAIRKQKCRGWAVGFGIGRSEDGTFSLTNNVNPRPFSLCFDCPYEEECRCDNSCDNPEGDGIVNEVNLRLHEILDPSDPEGGDVLQFVQVTFSTGTGYEAWSPPNPATWTGGAVQLGSVKVGKGQFYSDNLLNQACVGDGSHVYNTASQGNFTSRLTNECAPDVQLCRNPPDLEDRFVTFNIPLPKNYFDQTESTQGNQGNLGTTNYIFVDLGVKLRRINSPDGTATPVNKRILAQIPIVLGGVNTWCAVETASIGLDDVAQVDIMIGSAMNYTELDRLKILTDVASTNESNVKSHELNSASIESGLLTVILKGNSSFFVQPRTQQFKLEIEDIISLHIMENGDTTVFDDLQTMATGGTAFDITADRWGHHAEMSPTAALMNVCSFFPTPPSAARAFPHVCIARRDMRHREFPVRPGSFATAMEIDPSDTSNAQSDFMKTIFLDNDFAERLGTSFAANVVKKWNVNGRYIRAFWINPGYEWTPASVVGSFSRFTISQKIIVFILINLNEGFMRRRMILQTSAARENFRGAGQAAVTNNIDQTDVLVQVLASHGVSKSNIVGLDVKMKLTDVEACYSTNNLMDILHGRLEKALENAAKPSNGFLAQGLQITGIKVDKSTVQCDGARRSRVLLGSASATVNTLLAMDPSKNGVINLGQLQEQETVESVKRVGSGECTFCTNEPIDISQAPAEDQNGEKEQDEDEEDGGSDNKMMIIAAVCGSVGGVLVIVAGFMAWRMANKQEPASNVNVVEAVSLADLKSQLAAEISSP